MLKTAWQGDTTAGLELRSEARRCLSFVSTSAIWNKISYLAICSHALDPPAQRLACAVVGSVPQEVSIRLSRPHKSRTKPAKPCRLDASDYKRLIWPRLHGSLREGVYFTEVRICLGTSCVQAWLNPKRCCWDLPGTANAEF